MTTMDQIHSIREMFFVQGKNLTEIATIMHLDWRTVRKYVDMDDFNIAHTTPKSKAKKESKLDSFKELIDSWLIEDKKAPRKQRHTSKRIFNRLRDEAPGFNCSYRLVCAYVEQRRKELAADSNNFYIPLIHHPGESQADFGTANFRENGTLYEDAKFLVLSFPYSNGGYLQLSYGENMECLLEGLVAIFEHVGGVPTEIWFDNTKTIVTKVIYGGGRKITERFQRFIEHYRFIAKFMNPSSGWEKGNVENKVGYLRRNELVPVPEFRNITIKNKELLENCDKDMKREHYESPEGKFISEIFEEDRKAFLPLPSVPFDCAKYITVNTDKYGKFTLDGGKYRYSASPAFCNSHVNLKITSLQISVMDDDMHEIVCHRRLYKPGTESMDWVPYLKYISRKPRSLKNSGIYDMMPESMQSYMDICESSERGKILKVLAELTDRTGFESAIHTVDEAIVFKATDPDSLQNLYRRIYSEVPILEPLNSSLPSQKIIPFRNEVPNLEVLLRKGGASVG